MQTPAILLDPCHTTGLYVQYFKEVGWFWEYNLFNIMLIIPYKFFYCRLMSCKLIFPSILILSQVSVKLVLVRSLTANKEVLGSILDLVKD